MANHLARVLNRGIDFLAQGHTAEQFMGHVDARALPEAEREELRDLLILAGSLLPLRQLSVPTPRAKAANRARFLGQAVQHREETPSQPVPVQPPLLLRLRRGLAGLALAVAVVLLAGSGAVTAAAGSLPGTPLYPLKLAVEDARLAFTTDLPSRARLYMSFADQRIDEMVRLAAEGRPVEETVVARMAEQLQGALESARSVDADAQLELLEQLLKTSRSQHETLIKVGTEAPSEIQPELSAGAAVAAQASQQAQTALDELVPPAATPTPTDTNTPSPQPTQAAIVSPALSQTPTPSYTATASVTPSRTATRTTPTATLDTATLQPSGTPTTSPTATFTPRPGVTPVRTATDTPLSTRTASRTPSPITPTSTPSPVTVTLTPSPVTVTLTPTPSLVTPTATDTPEPTHTPEAAFRLTNEDNPDPVPASHRIHYVICAINESEVPLTSVVITSRWSPIQCVYLPPDNPTELVRQIGTVEPYSRRCVAFSLNTYSMCGGHTVRNEASMTCDQGSASAVQFTHIAGTPTPSITTTVTATIEATLTLTPTAALTATLTPTGTG